jgi:hypothetical protein
MFLEQISELLLLNVRQRLGHFNFCAEIWITVENRRRNFFVLSLVIVHVEFLVQLVVELRLRCVLVERNFNRVTQFWFFLHRYYFCVVLYNWLL